MADRLFSSWPMLATSATTPRTLPDRFSDTKTVKDFGAVGDGIIDDTLAIQAAVNWASNIIGIIFFPPGTYKVTGTITLPSNNAETSFIIRGCGELSMIVASGFTGYVFQRAMNLNGNGGGTCIEELFFSTSSSTISGIRLEGLVTAVISRVTISGCKIGIYIGPDCYQTAIRDCDLRGPTLPITTGTIGILTGCTAADILAGAGAPQGVSVSNCNIVDWDHGIQWAANGGNIHACRFEENNFGCYLGLDPDGNDFSTSVYMTNCGGEANTVGVYAQHVGSSAFIGLGFQGSNPSGTGAASQSGLRIKFATNTLFSNILCHLYFLTAAIECVSGSNLIYCTFNNVDGTVTTGGGSHWILPTNQAGASSLSFIQCHNNPANVFPFTNLPGQAGADVQLSGAIEGMQFDITDCSTSTFLATAAAAGTGSSAHRRVRYNASAALWQVVG